MGREGSFMIHQPPCVGLDMAVVSRWLCTGRVVVSPSCPLDSDVNSIFLGLFVIVAAATVVKVPNL